MESLEEAAGKYAGKYALSTRHISHIGFEDGAKWQAERMYSEEELLQALSLGFTSTDETWEQCVAFTKEQFKKK